MHKHVPRPRIHCLGTNIARIGTNQAKLVKMCNSKKSPPRIVAVFYRLEISVIILMPLFFHSSRFLSKSIMFVVPRYKIADILFAWAIFNNSGIGDSRVLPAANHVGSSIIQKSLSSCIAITALSVTTISLSNTSNFRFVFLKCAIISLSGIFSDSFVVL